MSIEQPELASSSEWESPTDGNASRIPSNTSVKDSINAWIDLRTADKLMLARFAQEAGEDRLAGLAMTSWRHTTVTRDVHVLISGTQLHENSSLRPPAFANSGLTCETGQDGS